MNKEIRRRSIFIIILCLAAISRAYSGTYYWDTNGSVAGAGDPATGAWASSGTTWSTSSTGSITPATHTTTYNDDLYFVAGASSSTSGDQPYTVTVSGVQSADSLNFQSAGAVTVSGGAIDLGGELVSGTYSTLSGISVPTFAFGTTPNGAVTVNDTINVESPITMSVGSGETLTLAGNIVEQNNGVNGEYGYLDTTTKTGLGTLLLTGVNSSNGLEGGLIVNQGTVEFGAGTATSGGGYDTFQVGKTNGSGLVSDAATLEIANPNVGLNRPVNFNNNSTFLVTGGDYKYLPTATISNGAAVTFATLTSSDELSLQSSQTLGGNSSSTLAFSGPGYTDISATLGFKGSYIVNGTVVLDTPNALGSGTITINSGGTLLGNSGGGAVTANPIILNGGTIGTGDQTYLQGGSVTVNAPSYLDNASTYGSVNYGDNIYDNVTLNAGLTVESVGTLGYNNVYFYGVLSGTGGVSVNIAPTSNSAYKGLYFETPQTYTGVTIVNSGQVFLTATNDLAYSTVDLSGTGTISWYNNNGQTNYIGGLQDLKGNSVLTFTNWAYNIGANNQSTIYSGSLNGGGPGQGIIKVGTGTLTISGNNSNYSGSFTVNAGTLEFTNENAWSGANNNYWVPEYMTVASGATLALGVGGPGDFTADDINGLLYDYGISSSATSNSGLEAGSILAFDTTDGNFTEGDIGGITDSNAGPIGLTKLGANTLTLDQANTYTGPTTVAAGTLIVTGAISGGGPVNVKAGVLGGNGSIAGATTVGTGAMLYPGADGASSGQTLTLGSTVTFSGTSTFEVNLDNAGHTADMLSITGNLVIGSNDTLTLNLLNSTPTTNSFEIVSYTGTRIGTFATVNWDGLTGYRVDYTVPGEILIDLAPVPEPGTWAEIVCGFGLLIVLQHGRRKSRRLI